MESSLALVNTLDSKIEYNFSYIHNMKLYYSIFQVFTFEFGGSKRVIISGYDTIQNVLIKNADYSSSRSVNSMTKNIRTIAAETPGKVIVHSSL